MSKSWKLLAALCCGAVICLAQFDTATILGTVTDSGNAVVPGAEVQIFNMGTSARTAATTNESGSFVASALPVGTYRVSVSVDGFKTYVQEGISLSVSGRVSLSIRLDPGVITEQITVVGEAPLLETASTTLGAVINEQQVVDLPLNGRAVDLLVSLAPGVINLAPPTLRSMNGGSGQRLWESGQKFLVDGGDSSQIDSDYSDSGYASTARVNRISVDAVAEFRVSESMASAEWGGSVGSIVNFISKSGTNEFHGSLFEFFRNDKLDARNYFNVAPQKKPAFRLNQFGGSLGGPIVRDKLFFFGNYEGVRQRQGVTFNTFVPTADFRASLPAILQPVVEQLPLPNGASSASEPRLGAYAESFSNALTEDAFMYKLDYNPTGNDRITFRHNYNDSFNKTFFGVGQGQNRNVPSLLQTAKLGYTRTFSPTVLNEASFYVNRVHQDPTAADTDDIRTFPRTTMGGGAAAVGPAVWDLQVANTLFTFADTVSIVKGKHQLKIGVHISRERQNKATFPQKFVTYLNLNDFAANRPFIVQTVGWPRQGMRNTQSAFYIQDDLQASRKLTFNLGLRYQYDTPPSESNGNIANFNFETNELDPRGSALLRTSRTNIAPRVGFAYTPFDGGQTVIRGGFSIFHVPMNAAYAQFVPANFLDISNQRIQTILDNPDLVGFPFPDISDAVGAQGLTAFNKDWATAYSAQWNFNIQQSLAKDTMLQVAYVGNRGLHYSPLIEANPFVPGTGVRRYRGWGGITYYTGCCNSSYNSLQVSLKRRFTSGFSYNVNYTWAHNLDHGASWGTGPYNPDDFSNEWGSADYDVRHVLQFDYTYQLPRLGRLPAWLGSGWQINGITVMRTGFPVTVACSCDPMQIGSTRSRANLVAGEPLRPAKVDTPNAQINIGAFSSPVSPAGPAPMGNAGRNLVTGPAAVNLDFSLFKDFVIKENQRLQFRAEIFNAFNTPQFSNPSANIAAPASFGRSFSTINSAGGFPSQRQLQFALKYLF